MGLFFEELGFRPTPIGALSLTRRRDHVLNVDVFEIKLGDEYLMTSLFTDSEVALATLGLADLDGDALDIVVGGLGLGFTAAAVLQDTRVRSLIVVDFLEAIIDWHNEGLIPLGPTLTKDERCRFVLGDFFALAADAEGFAPYQPGKLFDAILVDIDHSPEFWLDPKNAAFYGAEGLQKMATHLKPGGVFGLWSNEPPDQAFVDHLKSVFPIARGEAVSFRNELQDLDFTQSVYVARTT